MNQAEVDMILREAEAKKKKGRFSKLMVLIVLVLNILFALKVFQIVEEGFQEPTALVGAWFSFTTVELWSLASIKKRKESKAQAETIAQAQTQAVNTESMN